MRLPLSLLAAVLTVSPALAGQSEFGNILIIVIDDVGMEAFSSTAVGGDFAHTPVIDQLAAEGVTFLNAWSLPICGPTRACIQTGRHAFRTGVGTNLTYEGPALPQSEVTLPEMLDIGSTGGYSHAAIGKWHLTNDQVGGLMGPNLAGYSHYQGKLNSTTDVGDYFNWIEVTNGVESARSGYLTLETARRARDWIHAQSGPWMCHLAFHAAHLPLHIPPSNMITQPVPNFPPQNAEESRAAFKLMVEAMDRSIGELLIGIGGVIDNTTIILVGDNGTEGAWVGPPYHSYQSKGSLYQGGVNVPLIVRSPIVSQPGSKCLGLVHVTDIFASVAELAQVDLERALPEVEFDSISLVPYLLDPSISSLRKALYSERFNPKGVGQELYVDRKAIRNRRYKLIEQLNGQEFYDLYLDPFEKADLLREGLLSPAEEVALVELQFELKYVAQHGQPYEPSLPSPYTP